MNQVHPGNILFIGPYLKKPKGGISYVLAEYKKLYPSSHFLSSTSASNLFTNLIVFFFCLIRLLCILRRNRKIKIAHIHGASFLSFYRKYFIFKLLQLHKIQIIYHIHGAEYHLFYSRANRFTRRMIDDFVNNADCIICLSSQWRTFFESNFSPHKLVHLPNIVAYPNKPQPHVKYSNNRKFLFLGYVGERKGTWLLIDVLKEHHNELRGKAVFSIAGNGEIRKLQSLIDYHNLNDILTNVGWVDGDSKYQYLHTSDIYILPSYNEGLPISILEAMSYSLPIISTTVGGIPELVDKQNGFLFEPGDREQLWMAIKSLLEADMEKLNMLGNESFTKVKKHFPHAVRAQLDSLYFELLRVDH